MDIHRAYKVLGLLPGSAKETVHGAYRDLVQVWHPDRFSHNDRLQQKAQKNLKRINEAFEALKDYEQPAGGVGRPSLLSSTFSAVQDLGDILQTGAIQRPQPRPRDRPRDMVLGMENVKPRGSVGRRAKRRNHVRIAVVVALLVTAATVVVLLLL
jgi:hypothetical protein